MKLVAPILLALLGLGAGVAAGVALKPAPDQAPACAEDAHAPCEAAAADPLAPPSGGHEEEGHGATVVALDKPLVAPVFADDRVRAMVVASFAIALPADHAAEVEALSPRLRDAFLQAMFVHANSGGFDGAFTQGRKMEDLRAALLKAARQVFGATPVSDVLITEIARQDM
jgi:flagellar FliL protein